MTSVNNQQKTPAQIAEEKRLEEEAAAKKKAELDSQLAGGAASGTGFFDIIKQFIEFIFGMIFGKDGEEPEVGEDVGDPNAKPLSAMEKAAIGTNMIAAGMAHKWQDYKTKHKGEAVTLHSPVEGNATVTSPFGPRKAPTKGASTDHKGVDLVAPNGSDKILAAAEGIVLFADRAGKSGITLTIGHPDGSTTIYRHLRSMNGLPMLGAIVEQGQVVGLMGNTGNSTGKHLHFEARDENGVAHAPHIQGQSIAKGAVVHAGKDNAYYAALTNSDSHRKLAVSDSHTGLSIAPFKPVTGQRTHS